MTKSKKSLWPYGIIGALSIFAIFIVSVAVYISKKNVDLESKQYYTESVAYNDIIDMKKAFEALDEKPNVKVSAGNLSISFPNEYWSSIDSGSIEFYKPDDAAQDFKTTFNKLTASSVAFPLKDKTRGSWKMKFKFSMNAKQYFTESEISMP